MSTTYLAVSTLLVNNWTTSGVPSVAEARPATCPCCNEPSRRDGKLAVVGHGLRVRAVTDIGPVDVDVRCRRYRCRGCGAVIAVGLCDLAPRRRYTLCAIALALGLWMGGGLGGARTRLRVSTAAHFGDNAIGRWPTLRRWRAQTATLFAIAANEPDVLSVLLGRAPPEVATEATVVRMVCGAVSMVPGAEWLMAIRAAASVHHDPPDCAPDGSGSA